MLRRPKGDSEMSGHERGQCIRYKNIFTKSAMKPTTVCIALSGFIALGAWPEPASEGPSEKVAAHSSWVMCSAASKNFTLAV